MCLGSCILELGNSCAHTASRKGSHDPHLPRFNSLQSPPPASPSLLLPSFLPSCTQYLLNIYYYAAPWRTGRDGSGVLAALALGMGLRCAVHPGFHGSAVVHPGERQDRPGLAVEAGGTHSGSAVKEAEDLWVGHRGCSWKCEQSRGCGAGGGARESAGASLAKLWESRIRAEQF